MYGNIVYELVGFLTDTDTDTDTDEIVFPGHDYDEVEEPKTMRNLMLLLSHKSINILLKNKYLH